MPWALFAKMIFAFGYWVLNTLTERKLIAEGEAKQIAKQNEDALISLKKALDAINSVSNDANSVRNDENNRDA